MVFQRDALFVLRVMAGIEIDYQGSRLPHIYTAENRSEKPNRIDTSLLNSEIPYVHGRRWVRIIYSSQAQRSRRQCLFLSMGKPNRNRSSIGFRCASELDIVFRHFFIFFPVHTSSFSNDLVHLVKRASTRCII